eukprot:scaffold87510_cov47-Attheya_sp.AAC.1
MHDPDHSYLPRFISTQFLPFVHVLDDAWLPTVVLTCGDVLTASMKQTTTTCLPVSKHYEIACSRSGSIAFGRHVFSQQQIPIHTIGTTSYQIVWAKT